MFDDFDIHIQSDGFAAEWENYLFYCATNGDIVELVNTPAFQAGESGFKPRYRHQPCIEW